MVKSTVLLTALYAAVCTAQMLSPEEVKSLNEKGCKILCATGYAMKGICSCDETETKTSSASKKTNTPRDLGTLMSSLSEERERKD